MPQKKRYLEAGQIVNTHGIRGEVKIQPWADSPEFLKSFKYLYIDEKPCRLVRATVHKGMVIAEIEGVEDVNAAIRLKGRTVFIDREEAPLPKGGYFIQDIIGAKVVDENGAELGTLAEVMDMPGNDVYVVRGEREILIPAVPAFILNTDVENGVITVRMMEGL